MDGDTVKALIEKARALGPIASYRVVTLESNLAILSCDFDTLEKAIAHARDAEMESDDHPPIALVLDRDFNPVDHRRRDV